ncbi:hypothetical protein PPL_09080 [Heterostelium album PN500]|uniref:Uncharacterized protein n=1 Tax=Heterostelium pallidum (strain ATCC 26659 / Pp 5 / PN500) TaxID=670386 RepID=D3BKJ8_HETP5|nr:hypothetical protein PPL_09080 [Heterostelium album PN500]EFA78428.1 hypothetical protein PPL_09080 [Heterostelium album PN500]|eukprot:XP_020430553.1 hypothetical protein PPL_09080 [Heterostelium album PN500]
MNESNNNIENLTHNIDSLNVDQDKFVTALDDESTISNNKDNNVKNVNLEFQEQDKMNIDSDKHLDANNINNDNNNNNNNDNDKHLDNNNNNNIPTRTHEFDCKPRTSIVDIVLVCKSWFNVISKSLCHLDVKFSDTLAIEDFVMTIQPTHISKAKPPIGPEVNNIKSLVIRDIYPWRKSFDTFLDNILNNGVLETVTLMSEIVLLEHFINKHKTANRFNLLETIVDLDSNIDSKVAISHLKMIEKESTQLDKPTIQLNCLFDLNDNNFSLKGLTTIYKLELTNVSIKNLTSILQLRMSSLNVLKFKLADHGTDYSDLYYEQFNQLFQALKDDKHIESLSIDGNLNDSLSTVPQEPITKMFGNLLLENQTLTRLKLNHFYNLNQQFYSSLRKVSLRYLSLMMLNREHAKLLITSLIDNQSIYMLSLKHHYTMTETELEISIADLIVLSHLDSFVIGNSNNTDESVQPNSVVGYNIDFNYLKSIVTPVLYREFKNDFPFQLKKMLKETLEFVKKNGQINQFNVQMRLLISVSKTIIFDLFNQKLSNFFKLEMVPLFARPYCASIKALYTKHSVVTIMDCKSLIGRNEIEIIHGDKTGPLLTLAKFLLQNERSLSHIDAIPSSNIGLQTNSIANFLSFRLLTSLFEVRNNLKLNEFKITLKRFHKNELENRQQSTSHLEHQQNEHHHLIHQINTNSSFAIKYANAHLEYQVLKCITEFPESTNLPILNYLILLDTVVKIHDDLGWILANRLVSNHIAESIPILINDLVNKLSPFLSNLIGLF